MARPKKVVRKKSAPKKAARKAPGPSYLIGIDGSPASERALDRAIEMATESGARLSLITVEHLPAIEAPGLAGAAAVAVSFPEIAQVSDKLLDAAKRKAVAAGIEVEATFAASGDPASQIVKQADASRCDLVIVGSHGRKGLPRALLGSVAEKVVRRAPCAVLVIR